SHARSEPAAVRQQPWQQRLEELAAVEADLVTSPDPEFRFHSGLPS
ncbi:MAG: tRNA-(ms[2]io[6]A)-hydroxylase, partial [Gammaproteobacteria bacterium]|nr:tRNA-(ms[2]io[6]A)-hydroxylase [Gammaproteobacteria bacterium]